MFWKTLWRKKRGFFVDLETFRTDTEVYTDLIKQTKETCLELFPALHDTVFGEDDDFFLYYDGEVFTVYYFTPDANCGGSLVECVFDNKTAKRILEGEDLMNVLTEGEELYDVDTVSFFVVLNNLSRSLSAGKFICSPRRPRPSHCIGRG